MKKNLFIGLSLLISFQAAAQYKNAIPLDAPVTEKLPSTTLKDVSALHTFKQSQAAKKHKRSNTVWYNIVDYMGATAGIPVNDLYSFYGGPNPAGRLVINYLWPDSTIRFNGASSAGVTFLSIGQVLDPAVPIFQNLITFPDVNLTPASVYKLDSFALFCSYIRKPTQAAVVDTLILSFITEDNINLPSFGWIGAGPVNVNFGADTVTFRDQVFDSLGTKPRVQRNIAGGGAPLIIKKVLNQAAANDTIAGGWNYYKFAPNITVPANRSVSVSVSFKPGTTWVPFVDTIEKFNNFRFVSHEENLGTYFTYTEWDYNSSNVVTKYEDYIGNQNGWGGEYIPALAYGAAYAYEFHNMDWLLTCLNCNPTAADDAEEMMNYTVSPNPASDYIQFSFNLINSANEVNISLSNLLGQQVKSMELGTIKANFTQKVSMPISDIPAGLYIYTINADGKKISNKILVN